MLPRFLHIVMLATQSVLDQRPHRQYEAADDKQPNDGRRQAPVRSDLHVC